MTRQCAPAWAHSLPSTLALMAPFDLLASLAMDVYLPVIPAMPTALGTSAALIQLTLTVYMVLIGLGQLLFGPLSDRFGRRPVLLGGALLFTAASLGLALAQSGAAFLALRVVQALGASAALVATFATVRDVYAERPESQRIYGLLGALLAFVPAVGPIAGALLARAGGWRAIFMTLAVLGLGAAAHAFWRWPETLRRRSTAGAAPLRAILGSPAFQTYTLGFSAAMGSFFVFFSTAPGLLMARGAMAPWEFSLAFGSVALVMILATRFAAALARRWGTRGSLLRGLGVLMTGAVLLALAQALAPGAPVPALLAPMYLIACGIVLLVSVCAQGALRDFGHAAGLAVALYYALQSLFVGGLGTLAVLLLGPASHWPLAAYASGVPLLAGLSARRLPAQTD
ncbi:CmlA/FloR family chloramphenicol efflux MFS transporter [Xenophilus sp. Marseille-Q4582]|uniref:CmlA/FloR family chloramphenicol efflux MFS transporter n=1 Tax=Xenophilus sp. Marseille-Q4582 TaxID=2866600 RepID=UPI001CE446E5|nr:CmlA/FloR family chloramphenicol efflux MFS transporter [Xenophilus sp. Marseille-Q4582]